jgi:hypothetical protein
VSVYFITARELGFVKIGFTAGDPTGRKGKIQVDCPCIVRVEALLEGDLATEARFHERFAAHRHIGEWFRICPEIEAVISEYAYELDRPEKVAEPAPVGSTDGLIQKFVKSGNMSAFAEMLNVPISTVFEWRTKNRIPRWRHDDIQALATKRGVCLTADDFPQSAAA